MRTRLSNLWLRSRRDFWKQGLRIFGICGACFVFEACYGTPQGEYPSQHLDDVDISGRTLDQSGAPVAGTDLKLTLESTGQTVNVTSDEQGNFLFAGVDFGTGTYVITASDGLQTVGNARFVITERDLIADEKNLILNCKTNHHE